MSIGEPGEPTQLGRYALLGRLGEGGMGVVYLGRSPGGRLAAIKVVRERFAADAEYRARFRREVTAARRVTGAFTAPVLDADPEAPAPWLATGYLPGLTLRQAVTRFGPLPGEAIRTLAAGLAEGLAGIHQAGVSHRDLKPGNVLLTTHGPRIIDFGVARYVDATAITRAGTFIGTPGYMAPEQLSAGPVGPPADVFALGALLAYTTTGRPPFGDGPVAARLGRAVHGEVDLGGVADAELVELVRSCIRREPRDRPTASELLDLLGHAPASLPGTAWLPAPLVEAIDRCPSPTLPAAPVPVEAPGNDAATETGAISHRGVPRRAWLGAGAVMAVGAVAAIWWPRADHRAGTAAPPAQSLSTSSPRPVPRATLAWTAKVGDSLPTLDPVADVIVTRAEQTRGVDARTGRVRWSRDGPLGTAVSGTVLYTVGNAFDVAAIRAATGATVWRYQLAFGDWPGFTPVVAGSRVVFGQQRLRGLQAATGRLVWSATVEENFTIHGNGDFVFVPGEKHLIALNAADGRHRWTAPGVPSASDVVTGGGLVFASDNNGLLHALRASTGAEVWHSERRYGPWRLRPDGRVLYINDGSTALTALRADTGQPIWSTRVVPHSGLNWSLGIGSAGGTVYVNRLDRTILALDAASGDLLWSYEGTTALDGGVVAALGLVFVATDNGLLHALAPPPVAPRSGGGARATA